MTSTKVEIEFKNLSKNVDYLNQIINKEVEVLAVVKANAYGHGSVETTKALIGLGVDRFAVATLKEASELIDAKIQCYI